jgi:predicted secreted hydrolase
VHGLAWMDHQWGDMGGSSVRGWTWMALQLDDHADLSLVNERATSTRYAFRRWTMALLPGGRQVFVPQAIIMPLGTWRSPTTRTLYPSGWRVRVPALRLDVVVQPTVHDQEMSDPFTVLGHHTTYWEGSCTVVGTHAGHPVRGKAYTELTGFSPPPPEPQASH